MKNLFKLAVVLVALIVVGACSSSSSDPKDVAEKFLNHLNAKEYDKAKALGTESTVQMIEMMKSFSGMEGVEESEPAKIENLKCEIDADKATCTFTQKGEEDKIDLVKKDGKWLVDMKKENPMGDAVEDMGDAIGDALESAVDSVVEAVEEVTEGGE